MYMYIFCIPQHVLAHDTEDAAAGLSAHFPEVCRFVDAARKEPRGIVGDMQIIRLFVGPSVIQLILSFIVLKIMP